MDLELHDGKMVDVKDLVDKGKYDQFKSALAEASLLARRMPLVIDSEEAAEAAADAAFKEPTSPTQDDSLYLVSTGSHDSKY